MNAAPTQSTRTEEWRAFLVSTIRAIGVLVSLWVIFAGANSALPYIQPGADAVYAAKARSIRSGVLFRPGAAIKVVVFGNSQVLAGFQPELFDSLSGGRVSSYNLGLPGYLMFIANLEELCRRGERPTHVLMMFPWQDAPERSFNLFQPGIEDSQVMDGLFPFRKLPRNLVLFALRSRDRGGLRAYYAECRRQTESMLTNKGYYFIEGQSHYPGHCLPEDFRLQKDDPSRPFLRSAPTAGAAFQRLTSLMERYNLRVILVPRYFREGEVAPPEPQSSLAAKLAPFPMFSVPGPDYWLLPNRYFSDPTHLNEAGAAFYTRQLWELVGAQLQPTGSAPTPPEASPPSPR